MKKSLLILVILFMCGYIAAQQITQDKLKKSGNENDQAQEKRWMRSTEP